MSFEKQQVAAPVETPENRLDFTTVCPDRNAVEQYNAARGERKLDVHDWVRNDEIVKQATESWERILTKFDTLPESYKEALLTSFAPHMYGDNENYPMYNRLVDKHAQQSAERTTMV